MKIWETKTVSCEGEISNLLELCGGTGCQDYRGEIGAFKIISQEVASGNQENHSRDWTKVSAYAEQKRQNYWHCSDAWLSGIKIPEKLKSYQKNTKREIYDDQSPIENPILPQLSRMVIKMKRIRYRHSGKDTMDIRQNASPYKSAFLWKNRCIYNSEVRSFTPDHHDKQKS